MKAKNHLDKVTKMRFNSVPLEIIEILNTDLGINIEDRPSLICEKDFLIGILNNDKKCCNSYEDLINYVGFYHEFHCNKYYNIRYISSAIELIYPIVKLISDMVKTGILDKYRG